MRDNIIGNKDHLRLLSLFSQYPFCDTSDHAVCRSKERQPEFEDDGIGFEVRSKFACISPGEGIDRVNDLHGIYWYSSIPGFFLRFPREQHFWILTAERDDLHFMSPLDQRMIQK